MISGRTPRCAGGAGSGAEATNAMIRDGPGRGGGGKAGWTAGASGGERPLRPGVQNGSTFPRRRLSVPRSNTVIGSPPFTTTLSWEPKSRRTSTKPLAGKAFSTIR